MKSNIIFKSIGKVQCDFREEDARKYPTNRLAIVASLIIDHRFVAALDGIESYSHLIILYHMHRANIMKELRIHPQGRKEIAKVGVFATRSPCLPNLIGVTVVKLIERRHNVLKVKGLDAVNDTPILYIKPYTNTDVKQMIRVPEWTRSKK